MRNFPNTRRDCSKIKSISKTQCRLVPTERLIEWILIRNFAQSSLYNKRIIKDSPVVKEMVKGDTGRESLKYGKTKKKRR